MGTRLYVGNLAFGTTEETLREVFSADGRTVRSVAIINDRETGRSRGFAFVELASDEEAQAAIDALDGRDLDGRSLRINIAVARGGDRGPGPGGPPRGNFSDRGPPRTGFGDRGGDRGPPRDGPGDRGPPREGPGDRGPPRGGFGDRAPPRSPTDRPRSFGGPSGSFGRPPPEPAPPLEEGRRGRAKRLDDRVAKKRTEQRGGRFRDDDFDDDY